MVHFVNEKLNEMILTYFLTTMNLDECLNLMIVAILTMIIYSFMKFLHWSSNYSKLLGLIYILLLTESFIDIMIYTFLNLTSFVWKHFYLMNKEHGPNFIMAFIPLVPLFSLVAGFDWFGLQDEYYSDQFVNGTLPMEFVCGHEYTYLNNSLYGLSPDWTVVSSSPLTCNQEFSAWFYNVAVTTFEFFVAHTLEGSDTIFKNNSGSI